MALVQRSKTIFVARNGFDAQGSRTQRSSERQPTAASGRAPAKLALLVVDRRALHTRGVGVDSGGGAPRELRERVLAGFYARPRARRRRGSRELACARMCERIERALAASFKSWRARPSPTARICVKCGDRDCRMRARARFAQSALCARSRTCGSVNQRAQKANKKRVFLLLLLLLRLLTLDAC